MMLVNNSLQTYEVARDALQKVMDNIVNIEKCNQGLFYKEDDNYLPIFTSSIQDFRASVSDLNNLLEEICMEIEQVEFEKWEEEEIRMEEEYYNERFAYN